MAEAAFWANPALTKLLGDVEPSAQDAPVVSQALNSAIFEDRLDQVDDLFAGTKDINAHALGGSKALFTAVMIGRRACSGGCWIMEQTRAPANRSEKAASPEPPRRGHVEVVRPLLSYRADSRPEADSRYRALQSAVWNGHAEVARILKEAGLK